MTTGLPGTDLMWGRELVLDLDGCDPATISDRDALVRFAAELCERIAMTPYGDPIAVRFALDNPDAAGYSLVQLITTSSIVAHFSELRRSAYVNVFSCRDFDTEDAAAFIAEYFGAERRVGHVLRRGGAAPS
jgi:S-adenosylmethionine/arginine decarboxylase-like enzyme